MTFINFHLFLPTSRIITKDEPDFIFNKPLPEGLRAAFVTPLTDVIYRNEKSHKNFTLKVCKEQVITINIAMYFQKNFFFRDAMDRKINELSESGILKYWIQKFSDKRFMNWQGSSTGPNKLQLHHLYGIFNMGLIGIGIALVAFIVEIFNLTIKKVFRIK